MSNNFLVRKRIFNYKCGHIMVDEFSVQVHLGENELPVRCWGCNEVIHSKAQDLFNDAIPRNMRGFAHENNCPAILKRMSALWETNKNISPEKRSEHYSKHPIPSVIIYDDFCFLCPPPKKKY